MKQSPMRRWQIVPLVDVASPPLLAGKEYEEALAGGAHPDTYLEYCRMLEDVFPRPQCVRKLGSGRGSIHQPVANLGRRPRLVPVALSSTSSGIPGQATPLLRGRCDLAEGKGLVGSCAWGSFQGRRTRCAP